MFLNEYLKELFRVNNIYLKEIYIDAMLLNKNKKKGIHSHPCSNENIMKNTIYCTLNLTNNFPIAQIVLYCNNLTSKEEIISFIYKSIKYE